MWKLLNHTSEKKKQLKIGNCNFRKDTGQLDMIEFPDGKFSIGELHGRIEE